MIPTLSALWPSHSIARAIFCRFNSETVITCAESSPRTLSVTLMTAKVIRRASPTRPSSPFFGNPIDAGRRSAGDGRASPARGHGVEGASFAEFASVQEQVKQIEGRNHTQAEDKRGAHCAVGPTTY